MISKNEQKSRISELNPLHFKTPQTQNTLIMIRQNRKNKTRKTTPLRLF
jgi:hypothetical protein